VRHVIVLKEVLRMRQGSVVPLRYFETVHFCESGWEFFSYDGEHVTTGRV
jgi:hypothetical protein